MNAHVEGQPQVMARVREMATIRQARDDERMLGQDGVPEFSQIRQTPERDGMRRRHLDAGFTGDAGAGEG